VLPSNGRCDAIAWNALVHRADEATSVSASSLRAIPNPASSTPGHSNLVYWEPGFNL
jgi:hypothetical protein